MAGIPTTQSSITVNIGALSNALAAAIGQATSHTAGSTATGDTTAQQPASSSAGTSSSSAGIRTARDILPSFLKRRKPPAGKDSKTKRAKSVQVWDRDIVCIPERSMKNQTIPYPRGKYRASLGEKGLIGKVRLTSDMTENEVTVEICSVFSEQMSGRKDFPFDFLQPTGAGTKSLSVPSVSSSFCWTPQQVAKLGSKQPLYIVAKDVLIFQEYESIGTSSDEEENDPAIKGECSSTHETAGPSRTTNAETQREDVKVDPCRTSSKHATKRDIEEDAYRTYSNLIDLTSLSSSSEDEDVPECHDNGGCASLLNPSATMSAVSDLNITMAKHVILQHQKKVISGDDEEDKQRIFVRRRDLTKDTLSAFRKPTFDESKVLKVTFIGEASVDEGGPRREFFQLAVKEVLKMPSLFTGWPENVIPQHNVEAVAKNTYFTVGRLLSTCIVQGGQPPVCFSRGVADFIVYDEIRSKPCLKDIPCPSLQDKLRKVYTIKTTNELRKVIDEELDVRFECGYTKPSSQIVLSDRDKIVHAIWLHHVYFSPHAELIQLRKGFRETLQLEALISTHPEVIYGFLVPSAKFEVTADFLIDSFVIHYSAQGDNKRTAEEGVMLDWCEYVTECSGRGDVSLSMVLNFISGASKLPASGFDVNPSVRFTDLDVLPYVSTCDVSVTFPRSYSLLPYQEFRNKMDYCISNSFGFGAV